MVISAPAHRKEIKKILQNINNAKWHIYTFDPTIDILQGNTASERLNYFKRHAHELENFYHRLADKKSKEVLTQIVKGSLENDCDCYEMIAGESQYFPDFIVSNLTDEEIFLDAGAYTGDSISEFISMVHNKYSKIYAFEPDEMNMAIAKKEFKDDRIVFFEKGVGASEETLYFKNENNGADEGAHVVKEGSSYTASIQVVRIDDVIEDKVTYIKMDIEGMELLALKGAKRLIQNYKPMLAISIYHRTDDVVQIPQYVINELNGEYKLYLRHYWSCNGTDTVLFAI